MTDPTPLDELHAQIQSFSNSLADDQSEVGIVMAALVVWEEATHYAASGDQATPNGSIGLATNLLRTLERDIVGCSCESD